MPPAQKSRRVERCCYVEGGARCRRSGTGDPPLCNPHRVALRDIAAAHASPMPGFSGVRNLVDRFVNGKRVSRKNWEDAIGDLAAAVASGIGDQPPPGTSQPPPDDQERIDWGWMPPWARPNTRPPSTPPPAPPIDTDALARRKARIVMGFTPGQALTLEIIQKRRRELARKHHPDRGGSVEKMQTINAAADLLEAAITKR